jgi:hypothetical protein
MEDISVILDIIKEEEKLTISSEIDLNSLAPSTLFAIKELLEPINDPHISVE